MIDGDDGIGGGAQDGTDSFFALSEGIQGLAVRGDVGYQGHEMAWFSAAVWEGRDDFSGPYDISIAMEVAIFNFEEGDLSGHEGSQFIAIAGLIIGVDEGEKVDVAKFGFGVAEELAVGGIAFFEVAIEVGDGDTGGGMIEDFAKAGIAFLLFGPLAVSSG